MKIRYITPFSLDRNIGGAYNEAIKELPDDCYIVVRDGDTLFMTPESKWGKQIHDIIKANPQYGVIGCMTNRLKGAHQLYKGTFSENPDMNEHFRIAKELYDKHYSEVVPAPGVAGLCLIFHKSVWEKVKFVEKSIYFDTDFNNAVRKLGYKIGVARGLYVFHLYRWGHPDATNYKKHLFT